MSKEKRRVPKLRFPGFTEDWEQRKFNDLFKERREKTIKENEETLLSCAITGIYLNSELFSHFRGSSTIGYLKIKKYDLILSAQNLHLGNANINLFFENGMISPAYKVFELKSIDPYFINAWVKKDATKNFFLKATTEGASQCRKNIEWDVLLNQEIPVPNNLEQIAIGKFINKLDMNITLHQRKLNNLKLKKKALLQKLFPKNGERYPELRFPGFTDAWEQRKLNEFLSVSNLKNAENKYNKKDVLSVSGDYGIVNQIDFQGRSFAGASVSNYGVVEKGDIVYTKSPLKLNPYGIIKTNRLNNGIVSTLYAIYKTKENCDSKFIEHYFNLDSRLNQYLKPLVNKGAKNDMKVSSENALIGEVCFPKITEQVLIADLLDCLDIYITLHQRKLDHLQLQKKALLHQMFV